MVSRTNTKIIFGTVSDANQFRAMLFSFSAMGAIGFCMFTGDAIRRFHQLLDEVRNVSNKTSPEMSPQCSFSNEKCICGILSDGTLVSDVGINRLQQHMTRIWPSISFILKMFTIRELFTLVPDCNRCFIKVAWSVSPFVFIAIGIGMFIDHCYISVPILSVFSSCMIVFMLSIHDFAQRKKAAERASRRQIRIPPSEPADNRVKSWNEVL